MHLGRRYKFTEFVVWTGWEATCLVVWAALVTLVLHLTQWNFLTMPTPVLTVVGSALAIILGFKNAQCYARFNEALSLSGQLISSSYVLANKLTSTLCALDAEQSAPRLKEMFYRHFAWLTALRFFLRDRKAWENTSGWGNKWYSGIWPSFPLRRANPTSKRS